MKRSSLILKTFIAALILTAASNLAIAKDLKNEVPCPTPPKLLDGWYFGAQLGYDSYRVRNAVALPASSALSSNPILNVTGWAGGLVLGYGEMKNDWFYLASEIYVNSVNATQGYTKVDASTYTNRARVSSSIGLGILPGIKFTDSTLTYAKLGWNRAILQTEETITGTAVSSTTNDSSGFVFGFGIETLLLGHWSLRGEFDHTWYGTYNTAIPYRTKVSPSDNQFMLGLIYHYGPVYD